MCDGVKTAEVDFGRENEADIPLDGFHDLHPERMADIGTFVNDLARVEGRGGFAYTCPAFERTTPYAGTK